MDVGENEYNVKKISRMGPVSKKTVYRFSILNNRPVYHH
jgi:hypothetical protein